jgi:hypothetical protein
MGMLQFPEYAWLRGSTLNTVVEHGLNLRRNDRWIIPDYQRPLVWTEDQKVKFLESLILGLPVGSYTLHRNEDFNCEVIDGQQRWNAIFCYVDDEFPVFGLKYSELNQVTTRFFESLQFPHRLVTRLTYKDRVEAYERMAYGGTPHEPK